MAGQQHPDQPGNPGFGGDQPGENVDRGRDIIESPRPAAPGLTSPAEFWHADREASRSQGRGQRTSVRAIVGRPPEPAMQEKNEVNGRPFLADPRRRARQAQISDLIGPRSVAQDQIWRRRRPGEDVVGIRGNLRAGQLRPTECVEGCSPAPAQVSDLGVGVVPIWDA
jgi:hypothetical protein